MAKSSRENEIKLAFASPELARSALARAGAQEIHGRVFEDNVLFDRADRSLTVSGRMLRVRIAGERTVLTLKGPVEGGHRHKMRDEHETEVAAPDGLLRILEGLGFDPIYRYQKYRTTFRLGAILAELDETPLGTFVELEGAPDEIDRVAAMLGSAPADYILASYRELHERDAAAKGTAVGDLLLPSAGKTERG